MVSKKGLSIAAGAIALTFIFTTQTNDSDGISDQPAPPQTPLKDGIIRLPIGGTLFAMPITFETEPDLTFEDILTIFRLDPDMAESLSHFTPEFLASLSDEENKLLTSTFLQKLRQAIHAEQSNQNIAPPMTIPELGK